jgi:hypothetical protein
VKGVGFSENSEVGGFGFYPKQIWLSPIFALTLASKAVLVFACW